MINQKLVLIILLGGMLLSCSPQASVDSGLASFTKGQNSGLRQVADPTQGQILPISAKAIMGGEMIELEVAKTPEQQALGLMYRTELAGNRGMLFPFEQARYAKFWMKNVNISLDMIFLKDGRIEAIFANVPPCSKDPCDVYGPPTLINQVIELRGGRAAELGLKQGDTITLKFLDP